MTQPRKPDLSRILVTPVIVMVAGFLIAGIVGLGIGAAVSVVYVAVASRRGG